MQKIILAIFISITTCLSSAETTFLLIRHGQTDWNITERAQGHTNNPLNARGLEQAKNLAVKLIQSHPDINAIYSSDLDRAYVTALETAQQLHQSVEKREALREIYNGEAEGLTLEEEEAKYGAAMRELDARFPHYADRSQYSHIPDAETDYELLKRVAAELTNIAEKHPDEKVAVFVHGHIIKVMLTDILSGNGVPPIPNCAVVQVIYSTEAPVQFISIE